MKKEQERVTKLMRELVVEYDVPIQKTFEIIDAFQELGREICVKTVHDYLAEKKKKVKKK